MLAAGVGAGCGSDDETKPSIPAQATADLDARLAEVQRRMDAGGGACTDITNDTEPAVHRILEGLPSSVDPDVRDALVESFDHLFDLTNSQCDKKKGQETDTQTETTETTATTETETTETTETTPTETNTDTTPTDTVPTDTVPTDEGDDQGGGDGGGAQGPGQ